jgi:hypothetical protein
MDHDMDMEVDRICQNCGSFFQGSEDINARVCPSLGICLNDEAFEPFIDDIIEKEDFSSCHDLYLQKRYNGEKEACDDFTAPEMIDLPEGMSIYEYLHYEALDNELKNQNVDGIIQYFYSSDSETVNKALSAISIYFYSGNDGAFEGLLNYYLSLDPAESLDDVHLRKRIIDMLSRYDSNKRVIEAYVKELERTPSNNTTRQLYSLVLNRLKLCPHDIVDDLLFDLLNKKQYSYKMKNRIMEIIGL